MRFSTLLCALLLAASSGALAQEKPAAAPAAPPASQVVMPDAEKIVLLLRVAMVTLNDALQTGNFTVLRDMGAPGFREANTAARLSQSFSDLAAKGIDLSSVTIIAPQLTDPPGLDQANNMLRLKGLLSRPAGTDQFRDAVSGGRWALALVRDVGAARTARTGDASAKRGRARQHGREEAMSG